MLDYKGATPFNSAIASRVTSPQDLRQLFLQPQRTLNLTGDRRICASFARALYLTRPQVSWGVMPITININGERGSN
jgi:hypothetical protein